MCEQYEPFPTSGEPLPPAGRARSNYAHANWGDWCQGSHTEMPFFLISQEFLIFINLNCQWKPIISIKNWENLASYFCLDNEDVVSALSWQFTMWCHLISHLLILSRKPIGTVLESSCLVLILMRWDQCTYTCLHHNTPFYAFISHILTFVRFLILHDWIRRVASLPTETGKHDKWKWKWKTPGAWQIGQESWNFVISHSLLPTLHPELYQFCLFFATTK